MAVAEKACIRDQKGGSQFRRGGGEVERKGQSPGTLTKTPSQLEECYHRRKGVRSSPTDQMVLRTQVR